MTPQPGDFAVVSAGGLAGPIVGWAERTLLGAGRYGDYEHAFIYVGEEFACEQMTDAGISFDPGQSHEIIQAEPKGTGWAALTPHGKTLWLTGKIPLTEIQRINIVRAAILYLGTPYSFLDYLAIGLHRWHIPAPGLQGFIKDTKSMICSQEVDRCYQVAGVQLFDDQRWNGYVTPADLARLLPEAP